MGTTQSTQQQPPHWLLLEYWQALVLYWEHWLTMIRIADIEGQWGRHGLRRMYLESPEGHKCRHLRVRVNSRGIC
jgi:hypothetical protein